MKSIVKELYHDFEEIKGRNKRLSVEVNISNLDGDS